MPPDTPLILAFDTSAAHCAVALLEGPSVLASVVERMQRGQAERLMPLIEEVLAGASRNWSDLAMLAVGIGPGNFTGVRISVAAARGLAFALNIPAIGVSTLEALAHDRARPVLVTLDARRDRLYAQGFDMEPRGPELLEMADIASLDLPATTCCIGHRAEEIAAMHGAVAGPEIQAPLPEAFAHVARTRQGRPNPAPAPLYLRTADAALPSDPPPVILDDT